MDKQELLELLGPFPEKVPLKPIVLETQDFSSYTRELVEYAVEEGKRVKAFILIPKNVTGKTPAIFCHHQHAGNFELGKAEVVGINGAPDQAYARELVERGYITFAPDALAFEDRNWSDIPGAGILVEYYELATRLVQGKTLMAKVLHDIFVGIDYLMTRQEVDKNSVGFIGHSYGGRMAIWSPVFDKRIKASVSNCGCVNYKNSLSREAGIQMEFCIPGIMHWGDIEDVVKLVEPSSLLISATTKDKWSRGAEEIYKYAKPAFKRGHLELKIWEGEHSFTKEARECAYSFFDIHLVGH